MLNFGFIMLDRKLMDWRWYNDGNTMRLFLHLLMTANYQDRDFEDITVRRGQRAVTFLKLADELNMTLQSIRTAVSHLEKTGELTRTTNGKYTVFTVNSYDDFILPTNDQQNANNRSTDDQQSNNTNEININNNNKDNKEKKGSAAPVEDVSFESLSAEYGESNVREYEHRVRDWISSKGRAVTGNIWVTVEKWMRQDKITKPVFSDGFDPEKYKCFINNF